MEGGERPNGPSGPLLTSRTSNLGVQFSGEINVTTALISVGAQTLPCDETQKGWCDGQLDFMTGTGKSLAEAKEAILKDYAFNCRSCFITKAERKKLPKHPFSEKAGLWRGPQYLSLGGGGSMWTVDSVSGMVEGGPEIKAIIDAGFAGVCSAAGQKATGMELLAGQPSQQREQIAA